jgi:hypothetical protein
VRLSWSRTFSAQQLARIAAELEKKTSVSAKGEAEDFQATRCSTERCFQWF